MKGYCIRCKMIGVEMHDEFLCVDCVKAVRKEGTGR